jgi:hypothetical protein
MNTVINLLFLAALWGGAALLLALLLNRRPKAPEPTFAQVFALLPCDQSAILSDFGPGVASVLDYMESAGLVTRYNGYVIITQLGEEVAK